MRRQAVLTLFLLAFAVGLAGCGKPAKDPAVLAENEKLKVRNSELIRDKEKLIRELNRVSEERNEWKDKYNAAQVKLEELETLIQKLKVESAELKAALEELRKRNEELENERASLAGKLKDIEGVTVKRKGNEICVTMENKILFDSGKADLKPTALKALKRIAEALASDFKGRTIRIEGHTDSDPIRKSKYPSNWELSTARACAVLHRLEKYGLDPRHMYVAGFAFYRPLAPNDTPENKARNRRVEIYIMEAGK